MPDASNILIDVPVQVTIYDSTNGNLYLGYLSSENIQLTQKPLYNKIISGGWIQYGIRTTLSCQLLETDPTKIANLVTHRSKKQTIYIVAGNYGVKLSDCYITHKQNRDFEFGGDTVILLEAHTDIESDVEVFKNLLGAEGGFEVDTNTDGIADGWVNGGMSAVSRADPSFLNGAGNYHQLATADGAGDYIGNKTTFPFEQPITITFSVYAQSVSTPEQFTMNIRTLDSSDTLITNNSSSAKSATTTGTDRFSYSVNIADLDVDTIEIRLMQAVGAGSIKYDDAQLEFGSLSDYTEND